MNWDESEQLGDPEDAITTADNVSRTIKVQDVITMEMPIKQQVTVQLPHAATIELGPSVGLTKTVTIEPGPALGLTKSYSSTIETGPTLGMSLPQSASVDNGPIANLTLPSSDSQSNPPESPKDVVFKRVKNPKFVEGVKVIGTIVYPAFNVLHVGVSPINGTKAWIYGCKKFNLVDIEKGEIINSYTPSVIFSDLFSVDENNVIVEELMGKSLMKIHIKEDESMDVEPLIKTSVSKRGNEDSNTEEILKHSISKSGYSLTCIMQKKTCCCFCCFCCFPKRVLMIKRHDANGQLIMQRKLQKDGKNIFEYSVDSMKINGNGDVCVAGSNSSEDSTKGYNFLAVFTEQIKFRFFYPKGLRSSAKTGLYDIATDPNCNILLGYCSEIDIIDCNGVFLYSLKASFGIDGESRLLSVDHEGKAWICTETGRVVVIEYATWEITEMKK